MIPWFIATEPFTPADGNRWNKFIEWSGLTHLTEIVSLDHMLCPTVLPDLKDSYWPHIVNEDFMLEFFLDYEFLKGEITRISEKNILCVLRNPLGQPVAPLVANFEFLGYDLVDKDNDVSALTNCGGFPDVFANSELSRVGLLPDFERASEVQAELRMKYPEERHADCHLWGIFREIAK